MMVYSLVIPVLPTYSLALGADELIVGVIFSAFSVGLLVFSIPFGILSDRMGRKAFMIGGMFLLAATNITFVLSSDIYLLILARLIQGMSGAATWSAGLALLADTFDVSERAEKMGLAMSIMSVGTLLGPVVGGIIYDNLGYAPTFLIPSSLTVLLGVLLLFIPMHRKTCLTCKVNYTAPMGRAPIMFIAISAIIVAGAATFGIIEPYLPLYLFEKFSATPTAIGLTFGALSLVRMMSQPIIGRIYYRSGSNFMMPLGLMVSAIVIVTCMYMPSIVIIAAIFSLLGLTLNFALTPMLSLMSKLYGGDDETNTQGMVYGVYNTLFSVGLVLGPLIGGYVVTKSSLMVTMIGQAAILLAVGAACLMLVPGFRRRS